MKVNGWRTSVTGAATKSSRQVIRTTAPTRTAKPTVKVCTSGRMEKCMMANGSQESSTDMVSGRGPMVSHTLASGWAARLRAMVCMFLPTVTNMKESGISASEKVTDQTFSPMATVMLASMPRESLKASASTSGRMAAATLANSWMDSNTAMENGRKSRLTSSATRNAIRTRVSTSMTRSTDMVSLNGSLVTGTKAITWRTSATVTVWWSGQMRALIWASGIKVSSTAWVSWCSLMMSKELVSSKRTSLKNLLSAKIRLILTEISWKMNALISLKKYWSRKLNLRLICSDLCKKARLSLCKMKQQTLI